MPEGHEVPRSARYPFFFFTKKLPIQPIPQEQIKNEIQYLQNYIKNNPNNTTFIKEKLDKLRIQYLMSFHKPTLNSLRNDNKWRGFHPKNLYKILAVIYNDISRDSWEILNPKKEKKRKMYYDEKDYDEETFLINDIMNKITFLLAHKNDEKRTDMYNLNLDLINTRIQSLKNLLNNSEEKWEKNLSKFSSRSNSSEDEHEHYQNPITYEIPKLEKIPPGRDPLLELL